MSGKPAADRQNIPIYTDLYTAMRRYTFLYTAIQRYTLRYFSILVANMAETHPSVKSQHSLRLRTTVTGKPASHSSSHRLPAGGDGCVEAGKVVRGEFEPRGSEGIVDFLRIAGAGDGEQTRVLRQLPGERHPLVGDAKFRGDLAERVVRMLINRVKKPAERAPAHERQSKLFAVLQRMFRVGV